jgi:hypothetical protein
MASLSRIKLSKGSSKKSALLDTISKYPEFYLIAPESTATKQALENVETSSGTTMESTRSYPPVRAAMMYNPTEFFIEPDDDYGLSIGTPRATQLEFDQKSRWNELVSSLNLVYLFGSQLVGASHKMIVAEKNRVAVFPGDVEPVLRYIGDCLHRLPNRLPARSIAVSIEADDHSFVLVGLDQPRRVVLWDRDGQIVDVQEIKAFDPARLKPRSAWFPETMLIFDPDNFCKWHLDCYGPLFVHLPDPERTAADVLSRAGARPPLWEEKVSLDEIGEWRIRGQLFFCYPGYRQGEFVVLNALGFTLFSNCASAEDCRQRHLKRFDVMQFAWQFQECGSRMDSMQWHYTYRAGDWAFMTYASFEQYPLRISLPVDTDTFTKFYSKVFGASGIDLPPELLELTVYNWDNALSPIRFVDANITGLTTDTAVVEFDVIPAPEVKLEFV